MKANEKFVSGLESFGGIVGEQLGDMGLGYTMEKRPAHST